MPGSTVLLLCPLGLVVVPVHIVETSSTHWGWSFLAAFVLYSWFSIAPNYSGTIFGLRNCAGHISGNLCIFWQIFHNYFPHWLCFNFFCCCRLPHAPRCFSVHKLRGEKICFFIKPKENLSRVAREMPSSELLSISSLPHTPLHALHAISLVPVLQDEGANMFEASHCHHLQVGIRLLDLCRPLCRWSPQLHLSCHGGGTSSFSYFFPIEPDSIRCLAHWLMPLRLHWCDCGCCFSDRQKHPTLWSILQYFLMRGEGRKTIELNLLK